MDPKLINPIDQDLDKLEQEIRRLKVEYDIYFNGGTVRPPMDTKGRVETAIKRIYDQRGKSFGQRFRYNSLVARYNVMRELWRRQTQEREESGRPPTAEAHTAMRDHLEIIRCSDPKQEPEKVSEIYDHLIAAKRACGERIGNLTLPVFAQFLTARAEKAKQHFSAKDVEFVVGINDGKVKLTARAARPEPSDRIDIDA
jgi:hypothetical protein